MGRIVVEGSDIVVRLSWLEHVAARRGAVRVPVDALREVHIEPDWWRALRGECGKGLWIPRRCVGTRHMRYQQDFVAIKADGPVVCVELAPWAPFSRLAVSDPDPDRATEALLPLVPRYRIPGGPDSTSRPYE